MVCISLTLNFLHHIGTRGILRGRVFAVIASVISVPLKFHSWQASWRILASFIYLPRGPIGFGKFLSLFHGLEHIFILYLLEASGVVFDIQTYLVHFYLTMTLLLYCILFFPTKRGSPNSSFIFSSMPSKNGESQTVYMTVFIVGKVSNSRQ